MAFVLRSPHPVVFPPLIMHVPNTTGIARPSSAVGTEKSPSAEGSGPFGCGAKRAPTTVVATKSKSRSQKKIAPPFCELTDACAAIERVHRRNQVEPEKADRAAIVRARRKVQSAAGDAVDRSASGQAGDRRNELHRGTGMVHHHAEVVAMLQISRAERIRERSERRDREDRPRRINRGDRAVVRVLREVRTAPRVAKNVRTGSLVELLRDFPLKQVLRGVAGQFALIGKPRRRDETREEHHGLGICVVRAVDGDRNWRRWQVWEEKLRERVILRNVNLDLTGHDFIRLLHLGPRDRRRREYLAQIGDRIFCARQRERDSRALEEIEFVGLRGEARLFLRIKTHGSSLGSSWSERIDSACSELSHLIETRSDASRASVRNEIMVVLFPKFLPGCASSERFSVPSPLACAAVILAYTFPEPSMGMKAMKRRAGVGKKNRS